MEYYNTTTPSTSQIESPDINNSSNASTYSDHNGGSDCVEHYDYYQPTEKWLLGIVALPFIVMGLLANAMSVRIFSHRQMRTQPHNWYLLILAVSDSVILLGAFFVLTLPRLGEILAAWDAIAISYYSTPYMYSFMTLAQTVSVWMTVAMSFHRFIGVCLPYKATTILKRSHIKKLIVGVIFTSILFNCTRFFEVHIVQVCYMVPINTELPVLRPTALRMNELYRKTFYEWAYTLIMFAIPFTILIIVNSMVIMAIHKSRRIHAKLNIYDDSARKQELAKEISTSIMLVAIVVAFLTCNTLAFVVNLMEKLRLDDLYVLLVPWSNMLVMTNASINICIYCMFSDRYRQLMCYYLRFCGRAGGRSKSNNGENSTYNVNLSSF
ncbi:7 transmembrane receptor (rhodopsin family) domain-containing protein [Ditylenchus destructor]|uniref:7 transmembrane receptor (Rhodopsin family) domain-containing protein n=1 Tax=Ditylenchus destructor TaxID=166010 RepID=A0AAD4N1E7_9BILA|nr:7 transmembrane receptor (rhodopsin family) domain-containing protein [Ditylenchus destructor]